MRSTGCVPTDLLSGRRRGSFVFPMPAGAHPSSITGLLGYHPASKFVPHNFQATRIDSMSLGFSR